MNIKKTFSLILILFFSVALCQASTLEKVDNRIIHVDKQKSMLSIYFPVGDISSNNYIRIDLQHLSNSAKRTNLWRLTRGFHVTREKDNTFKNVYNKEFIYPGEWECAIMTLKDGKKNPDFMGGFHGYEEQNSVLIKVDDRQIEPSSIETFETNTIHFIQHSTMFEYGTDRPVAKHLKDYTIANSSIKLHQEVEWLEPMAIANSYLTMLPIARSLDDGAQITSHLTVGDNTTIYDVSKTNKDLDISGKNIKKSSIWGKESGLKVEVEVEYEPVLPGNKYFCSMYTPQNGYNKLYFDFSGKYQVQQGDKWTSDTSFSFFYEKKK